MKRKLFWVGVLLIMGALIYTVHGENTADRQKDAAAIKLACLDYVEGYYDGSTERVKRGVHPSLVKRRLQGDSLVEMNRDQLLAVVRKQATKPEIVVEVLDIHGDIAAAKVTSGFVDYCQLARFSNGWQVVNVLWSY